MQYKYAIIESDVVIANNIQEFFSKYPEYFCVGAQANYDQSLDLILEHAPSVVFINVDHQTENDCYTAFNFVNELYKYVQDLPYFIALSSSTELAYNCIKNNFFDYLVKPMNTFELRKTVARLSKKPMLTSNKLCLRSYKDYRFIDIGEILFLKADNTATDFFMLDGTKVSAYKTLKYFESVLPDNFTRIHNSYIVNQDFVSRIHFGKSKCSVKNSSIAIPFSKSYRENVVILEKTLSKRALVSLN